MTITRIGTNEKYQAGWSSAFGGKKSAAKIAEPKAAAKDTKGSAKKKASASPKKAAKKGKK